MYPMAGRLQAEKQHVQEQLPQIEVVIRGKVPRKLL